jgi:hypothetical protein
MKTRNNAQGKVNGQVKEMIFRGITVIVGVVVISWSVCAQNFWEKVLTNQNADNMAMIGTEIPFERSQVNLMTSTFKMEEATPSINSEEANFEFVEAELELQVEAYNASEYVDSEIEEETENYLNTGTEVSFESLEATLEQQVEAYNANEFVESELSADAESWTNSITEFNFEAIGNELERQVLKYNAGDFVSAELSNESANNSVVNFDSIEAELELQVEKYSAAKYVEAELTIEAEAVPNNNDTIEADLAPQMNQILLGSNYNAANYVSTDMAREIESIRVQKEFLNKAENETAREVDKEVEKYAMLLVSHLTNNSK